MIFMPELSKILDNELCALENSLFSEKETGVRINNIKNLKDLVNLDDDREARKKRELFDENIRTRQINLQEKQYDWDKEKFHEQMSFDKQKMDNLHEERMAELENEKIRLNNDAVKQENESKRIEEEARRREAEYKKQRRDKWIDTGIKVLLIGGTVIAGAVLHGAEIRLEQVYNGITPKRCGIYSKMVEGVTNLILR